MSNVVLPTMLSMFSTITGVLISSDAPDLPGLPDWFQWLIGPAGVFVCLVLIIRYYQNKDDKNERKLQEKQKEIDALRDAEHKRLEKEIQELKNKQS